jgi:hypothetical protein
VCVREGVDREGESAGPRPLEALHENKGRTPTRLHVALPRAQEGLAAHDVGEGDGRAVAAVRVRVAALGDGRGRDREGVDHRAAGAGRERADKEARRVGRRRCGVAHVGAGGEEGEVDGLARCPPAPHRGGLTALQHHVGSEVRSESERHRAHGGGQGGRRQERAEQAGRHD